MTQVQGPTLLRAFQRRVQSSLTSLPLFGAVEGVQSVSRVMQFATLLVACAALVSACTADLVAVPPKEDAGDLRDARPRASRPPSAIPSFRGGSAAAQAGSAASFSDASVLSPGSGELPSAGSDGEGDAGSAVEAPRAVALRPIHRYDFSGFGSYVFDGAGAAHGRALGGALLFGTGALRFDGLDDYVELPPGLLSPLSSVTILAWLQWDGGACFQRVFDFGSRIVLPIPPFTETVTSSFYLTVDRCPSNTPAVAYVEQQRREHTFAMAPLAAPAMVQLGVTFDGPTQMMRLIVNGVVVAEQKSAMRLAALRDELAWLGRSLFVADPWFAGELTELRIYDRALDERTLVQVFTAGPDVL